MTDKLINGVNEDALYDLFAKNEKLNDLYHGILYQDKVHNLKLYSIELINTLLTAKGSK